MGGRVAGLRGCVVVAIAGSGFIALWSRSSLPLENAAIVPEVQSAVPEPFLVADSANTLKP